MSEVELIPVLSTEEVAAVVKFLNKEKMANLIYRQPVGRHVISMCDSVSCYVMGADGLAKDLEAKLGIRFGETTPDERFTLLPIVCLGACDKAPTMQIDEDLVENVSAEKLDEIFEKYT